MRSSSVHASSLLADRGGPGGIHGMTPLPRRLPERGPHRLLWVAGGALVIVAGLGTMHRVGMRTLGLAIQARRRAIAALRLTAAQTQVNLEFEAENARIQSANRLKSEFLATMSHELRTPLNAIIGFSQLMHRGMVGPVSAEHKEYLGYIVTSSTHLLELINDVLDLAKVDAGKMEFRLEAVDLAGLLKEVRDTLTGLAAQHGVEVSTEVDADVRAARVDRGRVKQILVQLPVECD